MMLSSFLYGCFIINISSAIKETAITIRKNYSLKVPDALITATALVKNIPLFSADDIFKRVPDLNFVYVT
jgi:predicted nucleic acid-binding protein